MSPRKNFFLHGGQKAGSAGCIDVGRHDEKIFELIKNHPGNIDVRVKKTEKGKEYEGHDPDDWMWSDWPSDIPIPG